MTFDRPDPIKPPELTPLAGPIICPKGGVICLEMDLRSTPVVNIDFRDAQQSRIPLHLSLRRADRVLVANRWDHAGWRRELAFAAPLERRLHDLHLVFDGGAVLGCKVTLWLDGQRLGQLDSAPRPDRRGRMGLRRGFPALDQLHWMTWPDGLRSYRHLGQAGTSGPYLTPQMEVAWQGATAADALDLGDGGPWLEMLPIPSPGTALAGAVRYAMVPGRVWAGHEGESVTLTIRSPDGAGRTSLTLRRADIVAMLHKPEILWTLQRDRFACLQMLEHVHHARLWADVPAPAFALLQAQTMRPGLSRFQPDAGPAGRLAPPNALTVAAFVSAVDAFHAALAEQPSCDPLALFQQLVAAHHLPPPDIRALALQLSEWFCLHADPIALAQTALDLEVNLWRMPKDHWGDIAALPFLWAAGDWSGVLAALRDYPARSKGWVVTPALGWIATALGQDLPDLTGTRPPFRQRVSMMTALLELVAALSRSHQSQTGCLRLIQGVLDMLESLPTLLDWCESRFPELALKAFGLMPEFWDNVHARGGMGQIPELAALAQRFQDLRRAFEQADGKALWQNVLPFAQRDIAGNERVLRMASAAPFLPIAPDGMPDLAQIAGILPMPLVHETALRWLAAPRTDTARNALALDPSHPAHRAACAGLQNAANDVARPATSGVGVRLGTAVQTCLRQLAQGQAPGAAEILALIPRAQALATPEAGYVGCAALLALAEGLGRHGKHQLATNCIDAVLTVFAPPHPQPLRGHPALELALARFDDCCCDSALKARLRNVIAPDPALATPQGADSHAVALRARANPFADTLVTLISCRKYLSSRVPEIQAAWGDALAQFNIPMVTVVGRAADQPAAGATQLDGALLELDAPDEYEGLPQKMLALAEWARTKTGFSRIFKIDDDCFLNVEAMFSDPAFLTVPYYGRPLRRNSGDMDRAWHMARSVSPRGRLELDKSPEPSVYADGGAGYCLARPALFALKDARAMPRGRALEQISFMEDKLIGDLLALRGQEVAGPNYAISIFRKSAAGLPPLPQYENSFLPFAGSQIKLAHLDAGGAPLQARSALASPWPMPMKLWPCHMPARLGWAKNVLDLVSPAHRLEQAGSAPVAVISVMRNERFMLDHFLAHYRNLGVGAFLIADNGSDDGTLEHLAQQPDVAVFTTDTPYNLSRYGVTWQETLMAQFRAGRWSLLADADELAFWTLPDVQGHVHGHLPELLARPEFRDAEAVRLFMLDMYPKGPLSAVQFQRAPFAEAGCIDKLPLRAGWLGRGPWSNSATVTSALRHRLMAQAGAPARANLFVAQKYALLRYHPFLQLSAGLHYIRGARVAAPALGFGHFKYHAEFHAKARTEAARGQHFNNAEEYRKYQTLLAEGRDSLFDPTQSVRLEDCAFLQQLCQLG